MSGDVPSLFSQLMSHVARVLALPLVSFEILIYSLSIPLLQFPHHYDRGWSLSFYCPYLSQILLFYDPINTLCDFITFAHIPLSGTVL